MDPAEVDFLGMTSGYSATSTFTVTNVGDADLELYDLYIADDPSDAFFFEAVSDVTLAPAEAMDFEVVATLPAEGSAEGAILITCSDPVTPEVTVGLRAEE